MSVLKLTFPSDLTNAVWQSKKGVAAKFSTGLGATLLELEREFKRSRYDDGVDASSLAESDPVATLTVLEKLPEEFKRLGKALRDELQTTEKKLTEVHRSLKTNPLAGKACKHIEVMQRALKVFEEEVEGFPGALICAVVEEYLEAQKTERSWDQLEWVAQNAKQLRRSVVLSRSEVSKAATMNELRIAVGLYLVGQGLRELVAPWMQALQGNRALAKKVNNSLCAEGALVDLCDKLRFVCHPTLNNDTLLRGELEERRLKVLKGNPQATEGEVVKALAERFDAELKVADVGLCKILDVWEAAEEASTSISRLVVRYR